MPVIPDKNIPSPASRVLLAIALFLVIGWFVLRLPDHPDALGLAAFLRFPLELALAGLAIMLAPARIAKLLATVLTAVVLAILFLKMADIGTQAAFQRPFNPYLDVKMMSDGWNLFSRTVGLLPAALIVAGSILGLLLIGVVFYRAVFEMGSAGGNERRRIIAIFGIGGALGLGCLVMFPQARIADLQTPGYLERRLDLIARSVADLRAFEIELTQDEMPREGRGLFSAVAGRDVILLFIESYGRSAIEDPRYSVTTQPRLATIQSRLENLGFHSASAWLRSPTVGGLSWLAHGTFLSGLWVDSQARYDRLMISERPSLNRLFGEAGWQSVAVMPAITLEWPEATYYGYQQIFAAADLGYRGKPFNWVTMPDQYTLSAFDRLSRAPSRGAGKSVMAEIALISSHAPWTPVAKLVDWDAVGDGTVFDDQATSGDSPRTVWADPERVRRQYIATIDYSLEVVGDYVARFGRDAVFIVLGDHQPAAIVTGPDASRDVPIHIISADEALVARFEAEGFVSGLVPGPGGEDRPMSDMRAMLIRLLSEPSKN